MDTGKHEGSLPLPLTSASAHDSATGTQAMDNALSASELTVSSARAMVAQAIPDDQLAFFYALWFWVPAGLAMWSAIVWMVLRII